MKESRDFDPLTLVHHPRSADTRDRGDVRQAWIRELRERHSKGLDAPRWLWGGLLDLAALHEAAYLEHCRQYALGQR
jgi:uncharacterized protein (DUF2252 family)